MAEAAVFSYNAVMVSVYVRHDGRGMVADVHGWVCSVIHNYHGRDFSNGRRDCSCRHIQDVKITIEGANMEIPCVNSFDSCTVLHRRILTQFNTWDNRRGGCNISAVGIRNNNHLSISSIANRQKMLIKIASYSAVCVIQSYMFFIDIGQ